MKKVFATLANSVRRGGHCIAGREITDRDGKKFWGPWIRPVSQHGEGEVSSHGCLCDDGVPPAVLDIVEVSLSAKQESAHQPENYFIDASVRWRKVGQILPTWLPAIEDKPAHLWIQSGISTDRIHSSQVVASLTPFQSLYLIRPVNLRFRIWEDMYGAGGGSHKHRRAIFNFGNIEYNLAITDPTMDQRYFQSFPDLDQPTKEIFPRSPSNCLLGISLAAPFTDGYHCKVVATILEY
ncbi:MAG: hypothetical protein R6X19_09215 [Kiritimatiellia bacterium]